MKSNTEYFYGTGPGIVRVSDRIYQPIDVGSLLRKEHLQFEIPVLLRKILKASAWLLSGFIIGGFAGEYVADYTLSSYQFNFLLVAADFFQSLSVSTYLSTIFSAGVVGSMLSGMIGLLSLVKVPE